MVFNFREMWFSRYEMIEDKLKLSRFLSWTFCSCTIGMFCGFILFTHTFLCLGFYNYLIYLF